MRQNANLRKRRNVKLQKKSLWWDWKIENLNLIMIEKFRYILLYSDVSDEVQMDSNIDNVLFGTR